MDKDARPAMYIGGGVGMVPRAVIWGCLGGILMLAPFLMPPCDLVVAVFAGVLGGVFGSILGAIADVMDGKIAWAHVVAGLVLGGVGGIGLVVLLLWGMEKAGQHDCGMGAGLLVFYGTPIFCSVGGGLGVVVASIIAHWKHWRSRIPLRFR